MSHALAADPARVGNPARPSAARSWPGAAALLVAPALMLAGSLVQATPPTHDTAAELASIAAAPGRAEAALLLGFAGLVLSVPAYLAMGRLLRPSRPRLAAVGTGLAIAGVLALQALMGSGPVTVAMTAPGADRRSMIALTDRYESSWVVGVWVAVMLLGWALGPLLLAVGLWRSGLPVLGPLAVLVGLVLTASDAGRWSLAAGGVATWLGLAVVAREVLRRG